ncbi:hypothetical protein IP92_02696 [Pseudoduganella flava]|uniref:Aspartyl protease n=1 Tax=Pseudoduganella flava TaxID=871742 RepID=A0A562PU65_9BURK|nr:hypothetical protein [Pseudoduganella flava]QGZ39084.1 hypothetical protein GO485_08525 [Pseudoduganella flava]TWI47636.1 hypothetical protein IP92_02696 [Pseudoduganella flava]
MIGRAFVVAALFGVTTARAEVSVPVALEKGIPVAQLTIAGATYPFTFDIGSGRTVHLTREVMAAIPGLKLTGRKVQSSDLTGKVRDEEEFVIPDLVINGVSFGEVTGVSHEPWGLTIGEGAGPPPHSVIGLALFEKQPFVYDQSRLELRFGTPLALGKEWHPMSHERAHEGIVMTLSNPRGKYRMVFDTAANLSLVKPQSVQAQGDQTAKCDLFGPARPCEYVGVALEGGVPLKAYLMPLPDRFAADGILGADFFQAYGVYMDLANRTVALKPARPAAK